MCRSSENSNSSNDGSRMIIPKSGSRRKIAYSLIDAFHDLCLDKEDIIQGELSACK